MGQSRLGFLSSFTLWRELRHSSFIFSSWLFVSQITTKAPSFWAAAALHSCQYRSCFCRLWAHGNLVFQGKPAMASQPLMGRSTPPAWGHICLVCCIAVGSCSGDSPPDVKVGRDSLGHFLIDFNHNRLACWVSSTGPVLFLTSTRGTCKNTVTVTPFPLSLTPESHTLPPLVTVVRTLFCE